MVNNSQAQVALLLRSFWQKIAIVLSINWTISNQLTQIVTNIRAPTRTHAHPRARAGGIAHECLFPWIVNAWIQKIPDITYLNFQLILYRIYQFLRPTDFSGHWSRGGNRTKGSFFKEKLLHCCSNSWPLKWFPHNCRCTSSYASC